MSLWFPVGFMAWISCVSFMLAIIKGGHRVRGDGYEQKLYFQSTINTQNRNKEIKKKGREKSENVRRITERRSMDRRINTEENLITKRLKQRRLGQRRNMEGPGWQERSSMN